MRFVRPFRGKPSPLEISGLFLLSPAVYAKLNGHPIRSLLEELLGTALYKRVDRAIKRRTFSPRLVADLLAAIPNDGNPFLATMHAAAAGNTEAMAEMEATGDWETFYASFEKPLAYGKQYRVDVERACGPAAALLRRGEFERALALLRSEQVASVLLWREAEEALDGQIAPEDLKLLQFTGAMETELSCLAALDVQVQAQRGDSNSIVSALLPEDGSDLNPAAMFFRWIRESAGKPSMGEIVRELQLLDRSIHEVTLKKWNRGSQFPSETWLKLLSQWRPDLTRDDGIWNLYSAAQILMLLGYYGTRVSVTLSADPATAIPAQQRRPWPAFPHGHADFASWVRARYPAWLTYHRARIQTLPA